MLYHRLTFPLEAKKPYFYANFVATLDGKVQVLKDTEGYWPLGSKLDYETLIELRTYADCLIHGKTTALGHPTLRSLSKDSFQQLRKANGQTDPFVYIAVANHPTDELAPKLTSDNDNVTTIIVTSEQAVVSDTLSKATEVVRLGKSSVDLSLLPDFLSKRGLKTILVEGGPTLMGSFFEKGLIDEVFLTIAPKVIGDEEGHTLTMVEGFLFPPEHVPSFNLISVKQEGDELFLRYRKHEG